MRTAGHGPWLGCDPNTPRQGGRGPAQRGKPPLPHQPRARASQTALTEDLRNLHGGTIDLGILRHI